MATPGHNFEETVGLIPTTETLTSLLNIILVVIIFVTLPFIMKLIHPKKIKDRVLVDPELLKDVEVKEQLKTQQTNFINDKLDRSRLIVTIGGLFGLAI